MSNGNNTSGNLLNAFLNALSQGAGVPQSQPTQIIVAVPPAQTDHKIDANQALVLGMVILGAVLLFKD